MIRLALFLGLVSNLLYVGGLQSLIYVTISLKIIINSLPLMKLEKFLPVSQKIQFFCFYMIYKMPRRYTRKMKGGLLNKKIRKHIKNTYMIPKKMITELGRLVDSEDEFFIRLAEAGIHYPKTKFPKVGQEYLNPEDFGTYEIEHQIDSDIYKGLSPFKTTVSDGDWIYACGLCPEDKESCVLSEAMKTVALIDKKAKYNVDDLVRKLRESCGKQIINEDDVKIADLIQEQNDFFTKYLYFLPWALESNEVFYEKSASLAINMGFLEEADVNVLKESLSWKLLGCQPCMIFQGRLKQFCIDPFYLNESIEWVSNIYNEANWSSSEGLALFRQKADPLIETYRQKYKIDLTKTPDWWDNNFDKYKENIYAVIIMYEQAEHRLAFQKIQFYMTIMKSLLTNYVVLDKRGYDAVTKVPLLASFMVTSEMTKYGCAASIAREIESKMHALIKLFNSNGFQMSQAAYRTLDPFENAGLRDEYVGRYHTFIDEFLHLIANNDSLKDVMHNIFQTNVRDYIKMGQPLYLTGKQAEGLGICSLDLGKLVEELSAIMVSKGGRRKSRKRSAKKHRRRTAKKIR